MYLLRLKQYIKIAATTERIQAPQATKKL